jgi:hypothetical protein
VDEAIDVGRVRFVAVHVAEVIVPAAQRGRAPRGRQTGHEQLPW